MRFWSWGVCPRVLSDGSVRCCRASCRDVGVKTRKDRAVPGYLLCRTFLLCFFCLPLCFLNQWELVLPDISLSGIWVILYSAFFSFASPTALVWISPLLAIHPTIDGLPNGRAFPTCLPPCSVFLQVSFSRLQIRFRCPAPTDQRFLKSVLLVALCFALRVWVAGQAGGIQRSCACVGA